LGPSFSHPIFQRMLILKK
jgi:hypothetical protein